eukprot:m.23459 g.23459  ORF g.23459 m.23459 type:complete len:373 (+) comp14219_c0_seq1:75-1193(+)
MDVLGLRNRGENRCYMNSVLQALASIRCLFDLTTKTQNNELARTFCLTLQTINGVTTGARLNDVADTLIKSIQRFGGIHRLGEQDAHEFFVLLLDLIERLHNNNTIVAVSNRQGLYSLTQQLTPQQETQSQHHTAITPTMPTTATLVRRTIASAPDHHHDHDPRTKLPLVKSDSGVDCLTQPFSGLWVTSIFCPTCFKSSMLSISSFKCITLDVPSDGRATSVSDSIYSVFGLPESVEGYRCELCNTRCTCSKRTSFSRLPTVVCLHFNRLSSAHKKNNTHVQVTEWIDLASCCTLAVGSTKERKSIYRLNAVVQHLGDAYSGHYVCYRRDTHPSRLDGWLMVSDELVSPVSLERVLSVNPYIIIYEFHNEH